MRRRTLLSLFGSAVTGVSGYGMVTGTSDIRYERKWSRNTEFVEPFSHGFKSVTWDPRGFLYVNIDERAEWDGFAMTAPSGEPVLLWERPKNGRKTVHPLRYPNQIESGTYELLALVGNIMNHPASGGGPSRERLRSYEEVGRVTFPVNPVIMDLNVSITNDAGLVLQAWCGGNAAIDLLSVIVEGRTFGYPNDKPVGTGKWVTWTLDGRVFPRTSTEEGPCIRIPEEYTISIETQPATDIPSKIYQRSVTENFAFQLCESGEQS